MTGLSVKDKSAGKTQTGAAGTKIAFRPVVCSLSDLVGHAYVEDVCAARAFLTGESRDALLALATKKVDFFPQALQDRLVGLLSYVGKSCVPPAQGTSQGATSDAFRARSKPSASPRSCYGHFRLCEDGRLALCSKSAHYHASLGHAFPGYALVEHASHLGIPNATHNNARGHITRLVEEELVRKAAGVEAGKDGQLRRLLSSRHASDLNRVLNLETGSLAAEAAVKMVLARFYRVQADMPEPMYAGRTPVLVVMGDDDGTPQANYHGTTVLTQIMRGMWPELSDALERRQFLTIRAVRPNDIQGLEAVFETCNKPPFKVGGFFYELVMMNYGGRRLTEAFVQRADALCKKHDVPAIVDEIQTCVWSPEIFMFREYGIKPAVVVLGKGFPGGEYAASRVLFSAAMDNLPQFGALVTNGQEELASLAYLVTLRWAEANADITRAIGDHYEAGLNGLARQYPHLVSTIEGRRHLTAVCLKDLDTAQKFAARLQDAGLDISVQSYKEGCPPSALTKLPLTAGVETVDFVISQMEKALKAF